ncbi:hypothetical protein BH18ACT1_BH18ACT1_03210 [soil metagenome]|nr:hypothetical protein [Acidimicrobiia bacterium]
MPSSNTLARTLHDIGLAAWFGGSLMGAVGVNGAAAQADDPTERSKIASAGWARWTPVNLVAIGAHLAGGTVILGANRARLTGQAGVGQATAAKLVLTGAALVATAYSRALGQKVMDAGAPPVSGATEPSASTPPDVAAAQSKLKAMQWAIPALTAGILVTNARLGEQQRPKEVVSGLLHRLNPAA